MNFLFFDRLLGWVLLIALMAIALRVPFFRDRVRRWMRGKETIKMSQKENKAVVTKALKALNCTLEWGKDDADLIGKYDFQSGHFRIRIKEKDPYVQLSYLFFFETPIENIALVRTLCNQCNINAESLRMVYTINSEQSIVDVHLIAGLMVTENYATEMLRHTMSDIFAWQNAFVKHFGEAIKDNTQVALTDAETDNALFNRELYLLREQEMLHQMGQEDWRQNADQPMSIGRLLRTLLETDSVSPVRMTLKARDGVSEIDKEKSLDYDLADALIAEGRFVRNEATIGLDFYDARKPEHRRHLIIDIRQERGTDASLYYRLTVTLVPLSLGKTVTAVSAEHRPKVWSVLVAYDLSTPEHRLSEFRYMWKEALEKAKQNKEDELNDEQRLISECMDPKTGYNLYRGRMLFGQKRYLEALQHLENAFIVLHRQYHKMGPSAREKFFSACYFIGFCYSELRLYKQAYYYLEMTIPLRRVTYTEEYINILVNSHDFRAIDVINGLLTELENAQAIDDDEDSPQEHMIGFINFLKRRKAYVYIDLERYDEAEKLLKKMLDEPENSDFAISELAYIRKLKDRNANP